MLDDFRNDPQNGHMLNGQAPAEAWDEEIKRSPLDQLGENERHILSTHAEERLLTTTWRDDPTTGIQAASVLLQRGDRGVGSRRALNESGHITT